MLISLAQHQELSCSSSAHSRLRSGCPDVHIIMRDAPYHDCDSSQEGDSTVPSEVEDDDNDDSSSDVAPDSIHVAAVAAATGCNDKDRLVSGGDMGDKAVVCTARKPRSADYQDNRPKVKSDWPVFQEEKHKFFKECVRKSYV